MSTRILKLFFGVVLVNFCGTLLYGESDLRGPHLAHIVVSATDTIPLKERFGDHVTDETRNPFDIQTSIIDENVEYDAESGKYIITEKIGEEYYRMPTYMDFEEYLDWRAKQQEKDYFDRLAGVGSSRRSSNGLVDPMSKVDVKQNMADRLFGGNAVTIEPNGSVDMTLGVDYQNVKNPFIEPRLQRRGGFDFDMDIQMALDGKIGDKMDLGFNFDSQATFDFDNKMKIAYDSEKFSEDDIIKTIEAGDVSLPLRSQLIQGNQSLFGIKTEWQFGKMRVTGIASQQRSEQKDLVIENGALVQEFEVRPDEYDENRHFFLSHYARDNYEDALTNMPQIKSLYRINNIEVWVTNDQNSDLRNSATVAAIADLGESDLSRFGDPNPKFPPKSPLPADLVDINGNPLPDNSTSDLFLELVNDEFTRKIVNTTTELGSMSGYGMKQTRDFEVQSMRKLNPNEFTFNQQLGFISINIRLRPNQVLGVAYEYTYTQNGDKVYKVGELTNESNRGGVNEENDPEPEDVIYVKMLKSTNQRTDLPSWDLMMKNVYPLGTAQLNQEDFQLDIFYEDFSDATLKRFLPETTPDKDFRTIPLLEVFQLDKLNRQGDPQQDGVFDFIPNLTINTRTGSVFFPVLEPFGSSLLKLLDNDAELYKKYGYPTLYNNTITEARENLDANRFVIKGKYKSSISSEISLGGFNIPQGSVVVRAGSQILREGVDYDIDYGIGRIKIINDAYLQQGVPIRVSFEDQSLFSLQQKTMLGLRFDYEASKNLNLGATYMRLFERPYTEKVNLGDDPINNRIIGFDMNYSNEAPFITRLVDKLPFYSTKEPSAINFTAEVAALKPGHSKAINAGDAKGGVVSIDDFEGAGSSIPLGSRPNLWVLASTPYTDQLDKFEEAELVNDVNYGVNRAALNWYVLDNRNARSSQDNRESYYRRINQDELFDRDLPAGVIPDLLTFDLTYKPTERGPYNFDLPSGTPYSKGIEVDPTTQDIKLKDPESRWGGIMRYLPNNDFQASNFQYIEFWMLNPFMDSESNTHDPNENGMIYFNLGNVSEDVLKDNLQFYENSLPTPEENIPIENTNWGQVPLSIPQVNGFDQQNVNIQDLGFDGLGDNEEREVYTDYVDAVLEELPEVNRAFLNDPANDNFISYLDDRFSENTGIIDRYSRYNNPQGNAPDANSSIGTGNPIPDAEDLNDNRSLEQSESYYEYRIPIENEGSAIKRFDGDYITDTRELQVENGETEIWYRYRVPIAQGRPINDIQGFRSIQFIRMYMDGFKTRKTFRLAEFELVRNQWRQLPINCSSDAPPSDIDFVIDEIGLEENSQKEPFRYVMPKGIKRERLFNTFNNVQQDEKSLKMNVCGLPDSCEAMIYKLTEPDLRLFEKMQMFVHAESLDENVVDGDMALFIRLGKDFNNNFYEYEIPLTLTDPELANTVPTSTGEYNEQVWLQENYVNVALKAFTELKKARNLSGLPLTDEFVANVSEFLSPEDFQQDTTINRNANIKIKGNPSLGYIKGIVIGIRNKKGGVGSLCGEVWVNELRMAGIKEDGGVAGLARLELQLADLGDITASAQYSSVGWGALDQRVAERSLDRNIDYDVATNLELAKFTPSKWNLTIPFYAQHSKQLVRPKYDPYELDLTVEEVLESTPDPEDKLEVKDRSTQETKINTFAFSNVRKNRASGSKGSPKPWDISNLSASYSYTQTTYKDEIIKYDKADDYRGGLDYDYSKRPNYIQPFKGSKVKLLKEFNFNPLPNSYSFSTQLRRFKSEKLYRIPDPKEIEYLFNDSRFDWDRRYNLQWDFTKALNLTFSANNYGVVDELRQVGVRKSAADRDWVNERGEVQSGAIDDSERKDYIRNNIRDLGRNKNYDHRVVVNYTLPIRYLPYMDWISMKAQYSADYAWTRASINADSLGNVIQNNQSRSFNATFSFDKLYNKSKYFKSLDQRAPRRRSSRNEEKEDDKSEDKAPNSRSKRGSNKARVATGAEKFFVRPLLSLRSVKFTYKENLGTVVPGFLPSTTYLGMASGFNTPGWGFVAGLQPDIDIKNADNWLVNAGRNEWISKSIYQNQQVIQNNVQNYEARVELEPWRDFKINVNFKKQFVENHTEDFINTTIDPNNPIFRQLALRDVGSFEVTYFAMNTLFNEDIRSLFRKLSDSRSIISQRLADPSLEFPDVISHETDGFSYAKGLGRQHNDILVPAFIAAYSGQDPNLMELDLQKQIGARGYIPKPNWDLKYNGLSKIPMFRDIFNNVNITHGYKSTLRVSRYSSDLQYNSEDPFNIDPLINTRNYFARLEIPEIIISEQFSPIIGIDVKTKSNMNLNFEWKKTRNLLLSIGLGQLTESRATEYVFGFGFTKENVNIGFLTGGNRGGRRAQRPTADDIPEEPSSNRGGVSNSRGRELSFNIDFAFRDDVTWIHKLDDGATEKALRGLKSIRFNPSVDYDLNENLTLRMFFDYSNSKPYLSTSYPITSIQGGLTASFILN